MQDWSYNPSSSKDLTEYNGELGSACISCSLTATSYLLLMRFVSCSFASLSVSSVDGDAVVILSVVLSGSWPSVVASPEEILSARDFPDVCAGLSLSPREREVRSRESVSTLTVGTDSSSPSSEASAQSWSFLEGVVAVVML